MTKEQLIEELEATKKALRWEIARASEWESIARDAIKDLELVNNHIAMLRIKQGKGLKIGK